MLAPILYIIMLIDLSLLAFLGWQDRKYYSISNTEYYIAITILVLNILMLLLFEFQIELVTLLIGGTILIMYYANINKLLKKLLSPTDITIIFLIIFSATIPALMTLGIMLAYSQVRARISGFKYYPAFFRMFVFFGISTIITIVVTSI